MGTRKMSGRELLEHFTNRLEAVEASLPSLTEVKQLSQAPSDVAELEKLRNAYEGEPIVFPATWVPSWTNVLGTSSVLAGLQKLLSGIVQFSGICSGFYLQGRYGQSNGPAALIWFRRLMFSNFNMGLAKMNYAGRRFVNRITQLLIHLTIFVFQDRTQKDVIIIFSTAAAPRVPFGSNLNADEKENGDSLLGKFLNVDSRESMANILEEAVSVTGLYHPIPSSISKVFDFEAFVSEMNSMLFAEKDQLLYLTWRGLPSLKNLGSYSGPIEFEFFIRSLLHPTTSPQFVSEDAIVQRNLWIGAMVTSRIHFDALDNIHVCLSGKKLFHLYSPLALPYLYPKPWKEGSLNNFSSIESILLANPRVHADFFQNVKCWHTEVKAGEAIFVPAGWWHEVFTLQETVSANVWFSPNPVARFRPTLMHLKSMNGKHSREDSLDRFFLEYLFSLQIVAGKLLQVHVAKHGWRTSRLIQMYD